MAIASRLVPRSGKGIVLTSIFGLLFLFVAWQALAAWWQHGYSVGTRTGRVSKFSYKGSPLCRYWSGDLLISVGNAPAEVWKFTTDTRDENDPLIKAIQTAESSGGDRTTLHYREDRGRWWSCAKGETKSYITGVEKQP